MPYVLQLSLTTDTPKSLLRCTVLIHDIQLEYSKLTPIKQCSPTQLDLFVSFCHVWINLLLNVWFNWKHDYCISFGYFSTCRILTLYKVNSWYHCLSHLITTIRTVERTFLVYIYKAVMKLRHNRFLPPLSSFFYNLPSNGSGYMTVRYWQCHSKNPKNSNKYNKR